jgi:hypothetical protein
LRRVPLATPLRETVRPSAAFAPDDAVAGEVVTLGERIAIRGNDMAGIGTALHALIAAELVNPGCSDRLERASALLEGYGIDRALDAAAALAAADRLRDWIEQRYAPLQITCEYPIAHVLPDARVVRGWIDVLIATDDGWVIIDHKSSPRPRSESREEAVTHAGQLALYRNALAANGIRVAATWIHFAITGILVDVRSC